MDFALIDPETKESVIFPVAPSQIKISIGTKTMSFEPIVLGNVEIPRGRQPMTFEVSGMLPKSSTPLGKRASDLEPNEIVEKFKSWSDAGPYGKKLRLVISETDWNLPVFFQSFEPTIEKAGGNIPYSLTLTEYRNFEVKEIKNTQNVTQKKREETKTMPKTYTVVKGDSLWAISRKLTGSGNKWPELWNLNKSKLKSKNKDLIYPGEVLTIPKEWLK